MEGWEHVSIEVTCDILDRLRKPITKKDRVAGPFPYYGATGVLDHVEGYLFDEPLVLLGEDGAKWESGENSAFAIDGKCWVNNHAHVLRPNRDMLLDSWLIYYLNHSDLTPFITGLTVPKLNQGKLKQIPIPIPPLPEQERIVAILDEAFAAIATATANAEKNLANARELLESQLELAFTGDPANEGWREFRLDGLTTKIGSGATPKGGRKAYQSEGISLIRSLNVHDGEFKMKNLAFINNQQASKLSNVIVQEGDVLLNITGASIARCCVVPSHVLPARVNQHVSILRPVDDLARSDFLSLLLVAKKYKEALLTSGEKAGATRQALTKAQLQSFSVQIPTLPEQERIVAVLDEASTNSATLARIGEQKLAHLTDLKQSLLHKAFTGELTADSKAADRSLSEAGV
jgi:type I restriction enzyme S subunit